jgi:hypothetical protein
VAVAEIRKAVLRRADVRRPAPTQAGLS